MRTHLTIAYLGNFMGPAEWILLAAVWLFILLITYHSWIPHADAMARRLGRLVRKNQA